MKKIFKVIAGLLAACTTLAAFGGLSWWVSTEGSTVGYIAAGLFGIMAVLGAILAYIAIVFEDKSPSVRSTSNKATSEGELDPGTVAAAMLIATSDQFHDDNAADVDGDYDDVGDIE